MYKNVQINLQTPSNAQCFADPTYNPAATWPYRSTAFIRGNTHIPQHFMKKHIKAVYNKYTQTQTHIVDRRSLILTIKEDVFLIACISLAAQKNFQELFKG